jgi:thioredoxin reductase
VRSLRRRGRLFHATLESGRVERARRVLLATGVVDDLPDWPGLRRFYGRSVFHCPYCDGWEFRERRLAAWGETPAAAGLALKLTRWSRRVVLLTGGRYRLSRRRRSALAARGVAVREEPVTWLAGRGPALREVRFASGAALACDALFLAVGQRQGCDLFRRMGCRVAKRAIAADRRGRTSVAGLFAAGDASIDTQMVVVAASEGARAAIAINEELMADGL